MRFAISIPQDAGGDGEEVARLERDPAPFRIGVAVVYREVDEGASPSAA